MRATSVIFVAAMLSVGEMSTATNSFDGANANPEPERNLSALDEEHAGSVLALFGSPPFLFNNTRERQGFRGGVLRRL